MRSKDPVADAESARTSELEAKLRRAEQQAKAERIKRESVEKLLDEAQERLDKLAHLKFSAKTPKQVATKGSYCRVLIPDTHGSHVDEEAIAACLADIEIIKPKQVVHLGDALECGGFLASHMTLGYVAELEQQGFERDIAATNWLWDEIAKRAPDAELHYLEGNHEHRIQRWAVTQSLRNGGDAKYLLKMFSPQSVLHLEKRKVNWWALGEFHMGLRVRGAIKLGPAHFTHGSFTGKFATHRHVQEFGAHVFHGHIHRSDYVVLRNVKVGTVIGASPGFLAKLQPYWQHGSLTQWSHGYGLQLVLPNNDFLHVNVPIVDGISYLKPLRERLL